MSKFGSYYNIICTLLEIFEITNTNSQSTKSLHIILKFRFILRYNVLVSKKII